ncbi:MAG: DUF5667 domain-containing protein [Marmoricola sp.]
MTPLSPARRAAEEFASVVDGTRGEAGERYADLLECVDVLRGQEIPVPRTDFVADLRMRLMDAADELLLPVGAELAPVVPLGVHANRRQRRVSIAAAAFVVIGGTAGVAAAAESALPGDALYPIKRGLESAQVSLNSSDSGKGQDLLRMAGTRLDETQALMKQHESTAAITQTLSAFKSSASDGADLLFNDYQRNGDTADITRLRAMLGSQLSQLDQMASGAPAGTQAAFADAKQLLNDLDQQAAVLCSGCGGTGISDVGSTVAGPSLSNLLNIPTTTQADRAAAAAARSEKLAQRAGQIAKHTQTNLSPTKAGGTTTPPAGGTTTPPAGGLPLPKPDAGGLGGVVGELSSGVQALLGDSPLTDTLTNTLDGLGNLLK